MSRRRWHARIFLFAVLSALVIPGSTSIAIAPAHAAGPTVVSLTFDDGQSSQYSTLSMLSSRGMTGTYYINSAMVGSSGYYMTWPQIHNLANAGNEIGGHTLHHTNLTTVNTATATAEVCNDRTNLINQGFTPLVSFAYPEAESTATVRQIVRNCGYTSGRMVGDVGCGGCATAETIPPQDAFYLRTPDGVTTSTTLANLRSWVTNAENTGGGWLVMTFHGICDNRCTSSNSMSPSIFTAFLDWLAPRAANGTVVRTVGQVMGATPPGPDTTPPTTSIACDSGACATWYRTPSVTVSLSASDVGGSGVAATRYTTDGSDPTTSGQTYTGAFGVTQTTTVKYVSTDTAGNVETVRTQVIQFDRAGPAVGLTAPASVPRGTVVNVTATASDAGSGMAQVAFRVDGAQVAVDTTAPYGFSWNTRRESRSPHTLTAVARDVAGNTTTSAPVTVTVTR